MHLVNKSGQVFAFLLRSSKLSPGSNRRITQALIPRRILVEHRCLIDNRRRRSSAEQIRHLLRAPLSPFLPPSRVRAELNA